MDEMEGRQTVANFFAFKALSRVMGWTNRCKFVHTLICIIPRVQLPIQTEFAQGKDSANFGNPVVNFQHTNALKTKKNVVNMPAIFDHVVTSSVASKL